jgi:hypothetical protein
LGVGRRFRNARPGKSLRKLLFFRFHTPSAHIGSAFNTERHDLFVRLWLTARSHRRSVQHRTARPFFSAYMLMQRAAKYLFSTGHHNLFVRLWLTARSRRRSVQPGRLRPIASLAVGGPLPKPDEAKADLARSKCLPSKHSRSVGWSGTSRRQALRVPGAPEQTGDPT